MFLKYVRAPHRCKLLPNFLIINWTKFNYSPVNKQQQPNVPVNSKINLIGAYKLIKECPPKSIRRNWRVWPALIAL